MLRPERLTGVHAVRARKTSPRLMQRTENSTIVMDNVRGFVTNQIDQRSTDLAKQVLSTSENLRHIADQLRGDALTHGAADLANGAANATGRVGRYLQESDVDTLVSNAEEFSRERPWTVAIGGLLLGFAAARTLKAGSARRLRGPRTPDDAYAGSSDRYVTRGMESGTDATRGTATGYASSPRTPRAGTVHATE